MKRITPVQLFILFLSGWFLLNLFQAVFTEITNDEAYYAFWGKALDWGYFDHPPMVALFTYLGSLLFPRNLGVRFITVVTQLATLVLIWKTTGLRLNSNRSVVRFFALAASIVMFSAYGFITTPDVPLLLFAAFFLYAYRLFLKQDNLLNSLLLTVAMAGMVYSKYHAGLLIVMVVLSNLKLLLNYRFWLAGFLAIVLLIPHICWQIQHDFPAIQYHLFDRSTGFQWKYFLDYLPNQLAVFNPFTLIAVCWVLFSKRKIELFDRALYFIIIGFFLFFWGMTFRGHVEPHWTIVAALPMMILVMRESELNPKLERYIRRFVYPSLILVLMARVLLVTDLLPQRLKFHGKELKYTTLHAIAGDVPVIIRGSFEHPSLYHYFTGGKTQLISSLYTRRTQFDIWKFDTDFYHQPVLITGDYEGRSKLLCYVNGSTFRGFFTDSLQVTNHIRISYELPEKVVIPGDTIVMPVVLHNTSAQDYHFNHSVFPGELIGVFINKEKMIEVPAIYQINDSIPAGKEVSTEVKLAIPVLQVDACNFTLSLKSWFGPTLNAPVVPVKIHQP
ncbi:MAG: glycosyltransferase family 39 protein [Paludibacter sp.]|nr:glycosyltransferase family 39 protein [Paludibacter sp.]